jgi:serine/threonine protein phosphatase 1
VKVESSLAPGVLPEGRRVYAIGDVHGCLDRLVSLHWAIAADLAARPVRYSVLVHMGDYVDRGPHSRQVIDLLMGSIAPQVTFRLDLMGNHEAMMRQALDGDRRAAGHWLDNGGEQTLESYGVAEPMIVRPEEWRRAVPDMHMAFIDRLHPMHREGNYVFAHAGIRPGVPLKAQAPEDLMWIREPFLSDREQRDVVVVHGHTPKPEPEVLENRIGIDTGAVMGGKLTCLVLEGDRYRFIMK